jgi:alanine racemase
MAVVKANGYGHGIVEMAKAAAKAGSSYCGVARIDEAIELRRAGVKSPILVLGHTPSDRFRDAAERDISITLFQPEQVEHLPVLPGKKIAVHVKVDTGMSRLGAPPSVAYDLVHQLRARQGIFVEGIFTHYARADEPDEPITAQQELIFLDLLAELETANARPPIAHAANSAAAITRPHSRLDLVRIGIALYGMHPSEQVALPPALMPALAWKAQLSSVARIPAGRGVSYGHEYVTQKEERIGVIPAGYGDGYRWTRGNVVLIRGKKAPVVGRVCMDQFMVNLDHIPEAAVGDEVVLMGSQGEERIWAEDLAQTWNTINYEVTCGLSARVPRFYHD